MFSSQFSFCSQLYPELSVQTITFATDYIERSDPSLAGNTRGYRCKSLSRKTSGMWRRVSIVRTGVWYERIVSIMSMKRISELRTELAITRNYIKRLSIWRWVQLLVTANAVPSLLILFTLMMEAIRSSESSALIGHTVSRPRRRNSSLTLKLTLFCSMTIRNMPIFFRKYWVVVLVGTGGGASHWSRRAHDML
jgi:hypothetical protein